MIYYERGSASTSISDAELGAGLQQALKAIGPRRRVLAVPPDFTRYHSRAGRITELAWRYYGDSSQWWQIADANGLVFATDIKPGMTLSIPSSSNLGTVVRNRSFS